MIEPRHDTSDEALRRLLENLLADDEEESFEWNGTTYPRRFGRYRLLEFAGCGGHGCVFRADDTTMNTQVAIKFLRVSNTSVDIAARLRQEATVLAALNHPGIPAIRATGAFDPDDPLSFHVVMAWIEGEPLDAWRARSGRDLEEHCSLAASLAQIVSHAHQRGIIHRDIKPANILIDDECQPYVIDFGIAHVKDAQMRGTGVETARGEILGTLAYMSPELLELEGGADVRSDVFALGVILRELVLGRARFEGRDLTTAQMLECVREAAFPSLDDQGVQIPADLSAIAAKACSREIDRRYRSAAELEDDLRHWLRHEPVTARQAGMLERLLRFHRRQCVVSWLILTLVFVLAFLGIVIFKLTLSWRDEAERSTRYFQHVTDAAYGVVPLLTVASDELRRSLSELSSTTERNKKKENLQQIVTLFETLDQVEDSRFSTHRFVREYVAAHAASLDLLSDMALQSGDCRTALELRERVLERRRQLAGVSSASTDDLAEYSRSLAKLGDVYGALNDRERQFRFYQAALEWDELMCASRAGVLRHLDDVIWSRLRLIELHQATLHAPERIGWLPELHEMAVRLVDIDRSRDQSWCTLAFFTNYMAMLDRPGEFSFEECRRRAAVSLAISSPRIQTPRPEMKWVLAHFRSLTRMARLEMIAGRAEEADQLFEAARVIAEDLAARHPKLGDAHHVLAELCGHEADALSIIGEAEEAVRRRWMVVLHQRDAFHCEPYSLDRAIDFVCAALAWLRQIKDPINDSAMSIIAEAIECGMDFRRRAVANSFLLDSLARLLDSVQLESHRDPLEAASLLEEAKTVEHEHQLWLASRSR